MQTIYSNKSGMYEVLFDEASGDYYLYVVVGGIAMREVTTKMTPEMVDAFHRSEAEFLGYVKGIRLRG